MSKLLIVESPGKIKKISEYLGDEYIVMASIGHIIDLDEKTMSINLETFEPEYKIYDNKKDVVEKLKKQTNKVGKNNILLAADEDREGEMIAWSLAKELNISKPIRIVFNSITAKELKNAIDNPKTIDDNLVKAQQTRRILDRLAGYLISPLLFKSGFKGARSAGRVQSVVVKIIVDKEKEIINFFGEKKDTYFYITCLIKINEHEINTKLMYKNSENDITNETDEIYETEDSFDNNKNKKNKSKTKTKSISSKSCVIFEKNEEEKVVKIIKTMIKGEFKLFNITEKIRKNNSPPPFTTSTLQQYASQRFGMDAKRTMSVAQKLYESGHITYMRTDSISISEEALKSIKETIINKYSLSYHEEHKYINKKANTQEAHECIRPTKIQNDNIEGSSDEIKLYNCIWKRTIQSQMKAAEYQNMIIEIIIDQKLLEEYKLVGTIDNLVFDGYLIVDGKKKNNTIEITKLKKIEWKEINGIEDTQKPPTRYNDASLINKMDPKNLNIGRPSTYASFIEKIIKRNYVEIKDIEGKKIKVNKYFVKYENKKSIEKETKDLIIGKESKKLVPTLLGINITNFLELYFNKLMDYQFTANMEKELDDIAEGTINKFKMINEFYKYIMLCIDKIKPVEIIYPANPAIIIDVYDNKEIILLNGKYGKYLTYDNKKFNLKQLAIELKLEETDLENNKNLIKDKIIEKISNPTSDNNKIDQKEWLVKKIKYKLKKGIYGYYIEEIKNNNKKNNYSIKYLMDKICKDNSININDDINKIIELITTDDIEQTVKYFKEYKK